MFSQLLEEFHGAEVINFDGPASWRGPEFAYRLREDYDDEVKVAERLAALLKQPGCGQMSSLIIGAWTEAYEGGGTGEFLPQVVAAAPQLAGLKHLFVGEMTYEECEISWINQGDMAPLLQAYPRLESLRIRGGTGLKFSTVRHDGLRELAIETGGLSRSTLRELFLCEFPALEHLELLLGEEHYGFDGGVEDLQPLLSGRLFPQLRFLGLMNSVIANDIAAVLVNSPIVGRVEVVDLSLGNLDDEGVASLAGLAAYKNLRRLNISHHYASERAVAALATALPFELIADDRQEPDDEWRPIVHAE